MKKVYKAVATVFGLGNFPVAPGTVGSLAGLALLLPLHSYPFIYTAVFIILFLAGLWSASKVEEETGQIDPPNVIIDEVAGIFVVYMFLPLTVWGVLTGFVIYRLTDIIKLPPARYLERLRGGWGIMLDDLMSAVYANLALRFLSPFLQ